MTVDGEAYFKKLTRKIVKYFRFKNYSYKSIMLNGPYSVQVDETVIYKGAFIKSPSSLYDNMPALTWLVRFIEEHAGRIYIEIVENRTSLILLQS